ncbi:hypothetical protein E2C01_101092 [Portunus trituberculatus]|uniref:Uncharacterized protein n=1 Tax=Portunus trituberculatus TaxID=210409 RepID=A0A5B7K9R4_PORTR|nr:hypothetical protein [Portunus trituberculatus]
MALIHHRQISQWLSLYLSMRRLPSH